MKQKEFRHGRKLTLLAASAMLAACGGGGSSSSDGEGRPQIIDFKYPGGNTLLNGPTVLSATATSGLDVSYRTATPTTCTVSGNQLTLVSAGECLVIASQAGGTSADSVKWAAASEASQLFNVLKHPQEVTFAPPDYVLSASTTSVTLSATSDSGLPVTTFATDTPTTCSIAGDQLKLLGKGTCSVTATQSGNDNYSAKSVQRFVAVDPLLLADGFDKTNGTGEGYSDQIRTAQGGGVTVNPWDSTLNAGWERCDPGHPDWCYHTVSADGKTLTSALEVPKDKFPGWHYGFNKIDIFVPGKTAFDGGADTTGGLRVATETALSFTMGIPQGLYAAGVPIVLYLDLGKSNSGCNVELATAVWPRAPGSVAYNVPLSNFAVTNNCGIAGETAASVDDDIRKLPNPWDTQGKPTNLGAFNTALDGFKDARTSAANLLKSSDIIRFRLRLFDPNDKSAGPAFYSSSISISGAITIQ